MFAFAQWCEVMDGMNAAVIFGEDKVENGWQITDGCVAGSNNLSSLNLGKEGQQFAKRIFITGCSTSICTFGAILRLCVCMASMSFP